MRVYGTVPNGSGGTMWAVEETDPQGNNDKVYVTALCQVLLLSRNESPFFAEDGIPAQQDVIQQVFPDYYVSLIQQQYAAFFASLLILKQQSPTPTYRVNIMTNKGVVINASVPIPT